MSELCIPTQEHGNKKTPAIRFQGFGDDWKEVQLGEIVEQIIDNRGKNPKYYCIEGIPVIDNYMIKNKLYPNLKDANRFINKSLFESFIRSYNELDDVLITLVGNGIGNITLFPKEKSVIIQNTLGLRFLDNKKFMFYSLLSKNKEIVHLDRGMAQPSIRQDELLEINIECPKDKKEQTKIGKLFQQLDTLINQHQQKHDKLRCVKKALLTKMFPKQGETQPAIRFKGFSEAWEEKALGENVADIIGGGTPSTGIAEYWNGNIDWYSPTEIGKQVYAKGSEKQITELGLEKSSAKVLPENKTVLFTSRAGIGDMAILKKSGATNQGFQSLIMKEGYDSYFIYSAGYLIKEYALKHASGSTFLEISGKLLGKMPIKTASYKEQTKIGNLFQQLDTLINQQQTQFTKLGNIKQSMLAKMFV